MVTATITRPIEQLVADLHRRDIEIWVEEGRLHTQAAPGSITPELRAAIQERKGDLLTFLQQASNQRAQPAIQPHTHHDGLPLSFAQQRLWFLEQMGSGAAYNMVLSLRLQGVLDIGALQRALTEILRRHPTLRTTFPTVDGVPQQMIQPATELALPVIDLPPLTPAAQADEIARLARAEAQQRIDLTRDRLIRTKLLRLCGAISERNGHHAGSRITHHASRGDDHLLLITMHHIAFDGWSVGVLLKELEALYTAFVTGAPAVLPALPVQYTDFAVWQRAWLQGAVLDRQLTYWQKQLAGVPTLLQLPADRPRPAEQSFRGGRVTFVLAAATVTALKQLGQQSGSTLFMTLLAAFQVLLYRYTQQETFVIGTPIANRQHEELEPLIGLFANTLALRADLHAQNDQPLTFVELLARVRQSTQDAYDHQDLPFERLVEALQVERTLSHNPLVQVTFALMNAPLDTLALPGLASSRLVFNDVQSTRFDLELQLFAVEEQLEGVCTYSTDLFDRATIERLVGHFQTLLTAIVANPRQAIAELPILTAAERQQILVDWNDTATNYLQDQCVHHLFEAQAARTPDAVAVVFDEVGAGRAATAHHSPATLTYSELNARANQLAHYLRSLGVGSTLGAETLVGLCVERSLDMVVGLLAILKAGGAYVPLDPNYPQERLALMISDAKLPLLLTQAHLLPQLAPTPTQTICLDREWPQLATYCTDNLTQPLTPDHLAYVIYTSGSTGMPKGVLIEHKGLCNLVAAQQRHFGVGAADHVLQFSSLSFDAATFEIFMALGTGATLYISTRETLAPGEPLYHFLARNAISVVTLTPSTLAALPAKPLPALHTLTVAGEACSAALVNQWEAGRRFFNLYGPTEATIWATASACAATQQPPAIGQPIANVQLYLLDQARQPVPIGIPGELYIGGVGVARGYLHRPELTAEKFIDNPFGTGRLYKTGDLVRWLPAPTGLPNLEFLGRIDQQVKLRGFRIELGEIEAALADHPAVQEAVVVMREDTPGEKRLVAYITGDKVGSVDSDNPSSDHQRIFAELRSHLRSKLPDYMVPSAFVLLAALPLTPNGKVDRKALPVPDRSTQVAQATFAPPTTPAEVILAAIWSEVLGIEKIGIQNNFFESGGDSILSMQIVARANQAGLRVTTKQIFQHQTIAELATVAASAVAPQAEQGVVTGAVPLTPVQQWFFSQNQPEPHHFNQAYLLETAPNVNPVWVEQAIGALVAHHDALRMRYDQKDGQWYQENEKIAPPVAFKVIDLSADPPNEHQQRMAAAIAALQAGHHLQNGSLIAACLFRYGDEQAGRLFITIHHLVVDGVSWRVLIEDLQRAYQQLCSGAPVQLPPKTLSFKEWATWLAINGADAVAEEVDYWATLCQQPTSAIPLDHPAGVANNTMASTAEVVSTLTVAETQKLLRDLPALYHAQINDLLLTALALTFQQWTACSSVLFSMEGHGRESLQKQVDLGPLARIEQTARQDAGEELDLSRTVGWFTSIFPVRLTLAQDQHAIDKVIASIQAQLRAIPNRGIGYGILRYLAQEEQLIPATAPQISFNYLGQFDQMVGQQQTIAGKAQSPFILGFAPEAPSAMHSPLTRRTQLLDIYAMVTAGQLQVHWVFGRALHDQATIERLAGWYMNSLRRLLEHCPSQEASANHAPDDLTHALFTHEGMDALHRGQTRSAEGQQEEVQSVLSYPQQQVWLLEQLGSNAAYNATIYVPFAGDLHVAALSQALNEIVCRHAILHTTYPMVDDIPVPTPQVGVNLDLAVIDLGHLAAGEQTHEVQRLLAEEAKQPFDLTRDLMLRATLLSLGAKTPTMTHSQLDQQPERLTASSAIVAPCTHYLLMLTLHHIASDGWSLGILFKELQTLYAAFAHNRPSPLAELPLQYADFAHWQRQTVRGKKLKTLLAFWRQALAGAPTLLALPTDHPRPMVNSYHGRLRSFQVDAGLTTALRQLSQQQGATLFMTLLAAFQTLLYRYTGQETIVVGTPIANRTHPELEALIGFFANTLALRADLDKQSSFLTLLAQVRQTTQAAYDHQDLPFERLVEELHPDRTLSYNPLVQVMFVLQNTPTEDFTLAGLQVSPWKMETHATRLDLEMHFLERDGALEGHCVYNTDLFQQATIERLIGHFQRLLAGIVTNPEQSVAELPLLTGAEQQQILVEWNATATDYAKEQCIHQIFEAQAARTPDAVAVVFDRGALVRADAAVRQNDYSQSPNSPIIESLTYGELNARANQLAHKLQALGVRAGDLVGLCLERTPELIVTVLAILKAGGGYVPFDPTYPTERLAYMLANADVRLLITTRAIQPELAWLQETPCFTDWATLDSQPTTNPTNAATPESVLFCLYTSGSTGHPKGVLMPHRAIVNLIEWQLGYTTVGKEARTLQFSPINFDVSCQEIFATLCAGGTLVLVDEQTRRAPDALLQHLETHAVERLYLPFVALQQLAEMANGRMPTALREVNTAGEQLVVTPALANWFQSAACSLQNHYGPTETHVVTALKLPADVTTWPTLPSIGRPIANVQLYILTQARQPTPIGIPGELYIGGAALSQGYHQRPELTAERFIANPFGAGKLYKTGDLARWLADGNIEFLGRIDNQVKVRGFRIELGEVEALLLDHPAVQEAVVVVREVTSGDKRLVAYVTGVQATKGQNEQMDSVEDASSLPVHPLTSSVLRDYLHSKLPNYMIPSAFVLLDALPLTPNGKVDRNALPVPMLQSFENADFVPPQTATEELVAAIWMEVLGLPELGIHDDFFTIGGHSLLATQVISRVCRTFQINLPLRALFEAATVHTLSRLIEESIISELEALDEEELDEITSSTGEMEYMYG